MPLHMARCPIRSACRKGPMTISVSCTSSPHRWLATCRARLGPPTRDYEPSSRRTSSIAKRAPPRNATKADHFARLQKRLQKKGTRSATRRKIALSGRERRLKLQTNHRIAKSIVNAHPHTLIGLEELTGIRERTKRRKRRRKKKGKGTEPVSTKACRANRHASQWAFAELQQMISYKAALSGSLAIKVDADYTSQSCPYCGYADKRNRPGKDSCSSVATSSVPTARGQAIPIPCMPTWWVHAISRCE